MLSLVLATIFSLHAISFAATDACVGTISSLADVTNAVKCTTVNINGFTVPAGTGFKLPLATGTTVNLSEYRVFRDIAFL